MHIRTALAGLFLGLAAAATGAETAEAQSNSGAYLAGRHAQGEGDFSAATRYFSRALMQDPRNADLMESVIVAAVSLGDLERAAPIARSLVQAGAESQVANLVLVADAAERGAWDGVLADLDAGQTIGPLFDGLTRSWAEVGLGRMGDALAAFDAVAEQSGVEAFGLYHKALALASVGDFEGADAILTTEDGRSARLTRRGVVAHAQVLSQLERDEEAIAEIDAAGDDLDPELAALRERLAAGETVPFDVVTSAQDGMAENFFSIAAALNGEAADTYTLLYARLAEMLRPEHIDAVLMSADLLERLGQHEMAVEAYKRVPRGHPAFHAAELGRAAALERSGKVDAAIEVMQSLADTHGDLPVVHIALGDALRRLERYDEATKAYDRAIALFDEPSAAHWGVYFARGITHERQDRWEEAEADFRTALELRPGQPQVLNYLGYSMVEKLQDLDEALDLIERAVEAQPNSGYIVDSLGWVYYRLNRFDEAVEQLERAAELMPTDPVVNDHLGDALWVVGRKREAQFQWRRALSFDPEEDDAGRIRRKIEVGLDRVLADEGANSVTVAKEDG